MNRTMHTSKKLLVIVAHPDDETFGCGGTLAKYAQQGVEIHVLCATRGERGKGAGDLAKIREQELIAASKILGVKQVEFLDYIDGTLCNNQYHEIAEKIKAKITSFQPEVVITFNLTGISGHVDHVFISLVTTFVCRDFPNLKLFYLGELDEYLKEFPNYFIYMPPGLRKAQMSVTVDIATVWETKVKAMYAHISQLHDVERILRVKQKYPKQEYYTVFKAKARPGSTTDLFAY